MAKEKVDHRVPQAQVPPPELKEVIRVRVGQEIHQEFKPVKVERR